jgi:trk system potassium uptake protein TrkH
MNQIKKAKFWGSSRILIFSFLSIILAGTVLLMLPHAVHGDSLSFIDALFTSTSATCVTGLIVVDTGSRFTLFGQIIILLLIQLGGLGIMTFSTFFIFLIIGKFSLSDRDVIQETLTQSPIKNITGLLKTIFIFTISIEVIGGLLLTLCFLDQMPLKKASYYGIFHSISAFCNAGFSLLPNSFVDYQGTWSINLILMVLIVLGGIGFVVLNEFKRFLFKKEKQFRSSFSFHSKIALIITSILIVTGALIIYLFEHHNVLANKPVQTKLLIALFQSVTSRTTGFNTVDISSLTNASLFFIIILMFIGASPGSCGGGIKTTTAGVVFAMLVARFQNRDEVNIANRRIPNNIVSKAISVTFLSIVIIMLLTTLIVEVERAGISHQESRGLFLELLFEVVSAFGTVGLSTGLTSGLSAAGKFIIILAMFVGRLGPLTIALAIGKKEYPRFKYAQENLLVG